MNAAEHFEGKTQAGVKKPTKEWEPAPAIGNSFFTRFPENIELE